MEQWTYGKTGVDLKFHISELIKLTKILPVQRLLLAVKGTG